MGVGNAEDDVVRLLCRSKAGLRQTAAAGIATATHCEQVFYSTIGIAGVGRAVGVKEEREPGFPGWAIGRNENTGSSLSVQLNSRQTRIGD